jgi:hypothetical protein
VERLLELKKTLEEKRCLELKPVIDDQELRDTIERGGKYVREYMRMGLMVRLQEAVELTQLMEHDELCLQDRVQGKAYGMFKEV